MNYRESNTVWWSKHKWKVVASTIGAIAFFSWAFCFKMISPGYVGVIVDMLGDNKGVEAKELHVGMHWISPWKNV